MSYTQPLGTISVSGTSATVVGSLSANSLASTTTVTGASVTATGNVGGATLSATGAATAASVTASGNVQGATITSTGALSAGSVASTGAVLSSSVGGGIGYSTGAGGSVTQLTDKSTGVTINRPCGTIVTHDASLSAGAIISFTVTNSVVGANDVIYLQRKSGGTALSYSVLSDSIAAGSFVVALKNESVGALAEAISLNFVVIKSVIA